MTLQDLGTFEGLRLKVQRSISEIPPQVWDSLTGESQPFLSHAHFSALEKSGLTAPKNGCQPRYITAHAPGGEACAAVPAFLKSNSSGEMGVDLGLPMAHDRLCGSYYPKLQVEVPFCLIPGPRLLVNGANDATHARSALLSGLSALADVEGAQSIQISYMQDADRQAAQDSGFLTAETTNFVWRNPGVQDFKVWVSGMHRKGQIRVRDDYTSHLDAGVEFRATKGKALPKTAGDTTFRRYTATYAAHETDIWLNKPYFNEVFATFGDEIELHEAYEGDTWRGGYVCWASQDTLYAQHWLSETARNKLTFAFIHNSIAEGISRGLKAVDFGPLSPYKVFRGVEPEPVPHALRFLNPEFHALADTVLSKRNEAVRHERAELKGRLPFRTSSNNDKLYER